MAAAVAASIVIALGALAYAIGAGQLLRTAQTEFNKQIGLIHQAGMDAHRALGIAKALEQHITGTEPDSTGRHARAADQPPAERTP